MVGLLEIVGTINRGRLRIRGKELGLWEESKEVDQKEKRQRIELDNFAVKVK